VSVPRSSVGKSVARLKKKTIHSVQSLVPHKLFCRAEQQEEEEEEEEESERKEKDKKHMACSQCSKLKGLG
jgi:hypothetical protein